MREIKKVILHCAATREGKDIDAKTIKRWHTAPPRSWSDIGYHFVIKLDGTIERGRPIYRAGAHTKGHNADSVGVCYVGGLDSQGQPKDTMTAEQERSFRALYAALCMVFQDPTLHGHNEFSTKACPSFKVEEKFSDLV